MAQQVSLSGRVSNYLSYKLKENNITQAKFAEKMGVDERTVRRWVRGDIHKLDIVEELAIAFGDDYREIVCYESGDDPFLYRKTAPQGRCFDHCVYSLNEYLCS